MLSRDLENLHGMFDQNRRGGMHLAPEVVGRVCDAIEAMSERAMELEALCQLGDALPQGGLPENVTVLSLEALQRRTVPVVDCRDDPGPGDAA